MSVTTPAVARSSVTPRHAAAHVAIGAALAALAVVGAVEWSTGLWVVAVFAVLPDSAFLLAVGAPHRPGQLPYRAVPAYNALHHPVSPLLLLLAAVAGPLGDLWVVAGVTWGAHIAFDRACGYGLRTRDGWQRA
jgi:hypothetical protein